MSLRVLMAVTSHEALSVPLNMPLGAQFTGVANCPSKRPIWPGAPRVGQAGWPTATMALTFPYGHGGLLSRAQ